MCIHLIPVWCPRTIFCLHVPSYIVKLPSNTGQCPTLPFDAHGVECQGSEDKESRKNVPSTKKAFSSKCLEFHVNKKPSTTGLVHQLPAAGLSRSLPIACSMQWLWTSVQTMPGVL